jgi:HEPN domain-containing protein
VRTLRRTHEEVSNVVERVERKPNPSVLIEIAQKDFEATKVLFEKSLCSQAIYMLQQSLEKAIKALLLKFSIVKSEKELKKEIGHDVVKSALDLSANKLSDGLREVQRMLLQFKDLPEELRDLRLLAQEVEEYARQVREEFLKEKGELFELMKKVKEKAFDPADENVIKRVNEVVDKAANLSWLLALPRMEVVERFALTISKYGKFLKSVEEYMDELLADIYLSDALALLMVCHIPFEPEIILDLRYWRPKIEENAFLVWWGKDVIEQLEKTEMLKRIEEFIKKKRTSECEEILEAIKKGIGLSVEEKK